MNKNLWNHTYLDTLDTIRTKNTEANLTDNVMIGRMSLMSALILRQCPVLSQTQCFDSLPVMEAYQEEGFKELIRKGLIKTTWYGKEGTPLDALKSNLAKGVNDNRDFFVFSAFPFFNQPGDSDDLKRELRRHCLDWIQNGCRGSLGLDKKDNESFEKLCFHLLELKEEFEMHHYEAVRSPFCLSECINELIRRFETITEPCSKNIACQLKRLRDLVYQEVPESKNERSSYYSYMEKLDADASLCRKLRSIINFEYNKVVGYSLIQHTGNIGLTVNGYQQSMDQELFDIVFSYQDTCQNVNFTSVDMDTDSSLKILTWDDIYCFVELLKEWDGEVEDGRLTREAMQDKLQEEYQLKLKDRLGMRISKKGCELIAAPRKSNLVLSTVKIVNLATPVIKLLSAIVGCELPTKLETVLSAGMAAEKVAEAVQFFDLENKLQNIHHRYEVKGAIYQGLRKGTH